MALVRGDEGSIVKVGKGEGSGRLGELEVVGESSEAVGVVVEPWVLDLKILSW